MTDHDHDHEITAADAGRLELLDRLRERVPEIDLDEHTIEWDVLPDDGAAALHVDGGFMTDVGMTFACHAADLHAIGSLGLLIPGTFGLVSIKPNGDRVIERVVPDPLAQQKPG